MPNTHLRQSIPAHFWLHQSDHFTSCTSVEEICRHPGPYILNVASSFSSPDTDQEIVPVMYTLSDTLSVAGLIFTADHYCTTTCTHSLHIYYLSQLFTSSGHKHMQCIYIPGTCIPSNTTLIIQLLITILILTSRHPIYINIHINYINQYIISISTNQPQKTARKPKAKYQDLWPITATMQ